MSIGKKLLVLVDGSERTIQTVNYIKTFMPFEENTRIVLYHVFSGLPEEYQELCKDPACLNALQQLNHQKTIEQREIMAYLQQAQKDLVAGGYREASIEVKFHPLERGVARDIVDEARKGYSAVVLRRRGLGALKNVILGSVAVKLLQSLSFLPIIFVGQVPPRRKILLAVDASPASMKAVEFVASFLGRPEYQVCIFNAIPSLGAIKFDFVEVKQPALSENASPDNCIEAFKSKMVHLFEDIEKKLISAGFEPGKISKKIITGVYSRSEAIVKEAEEGGFGTIVVGRRGLSKVEAFFMGRVGHKVIHLGKKFTVWVV